MLSPWLTMTARVDQFGEFEILKRLARSRNLQTPRKVIQGIGDDAAVLPSSGSRSLLWACDSVVEGVHFDQTATGYHIGHKALAAAISDIAAMGGEPAYALIAMGLPPHKTLRFVHQVYAGLGRCGRRFRTAIVGGDTFRDQKVSLHVSVLGWAHPRGVVTRSGARVGDGVFVTGRWGGSGQRGRHLRVTPRLAEARYLMEKGPPTAMIDGSDGLAADLGHILEASDCGAILWADQIPCQRGASLEQALFEGEDFELIFTGSLSWGKKLLQRSPYRFSCVGEITGKGKGLQLQTAEGRMRPLKPRGFDHFRS